MALALSIACCAAVCPDSAGGRGPGRLAGFGSGGATIAGGAAAFVQAGRGTGNGMGGAAVGRGEDEHVNFGAPQKEGAHLVDLPSVARQWLALARRLLAGPQSRLAWVPQLAVVPLPWVREAAAAGGVPSESSFWAE